MKFNDIYNFILESSGSPIPNSFASTIRFNRDVKKTNKQANALIVRFLDAVDNGKIPKLEPKRRKFLTQADGGVADLRDQGVPPATSLQVFGIQIRHAKPSVHLVCTVYEGKCILMVASDDYNEYNKAIDSLPGPR